VARGGTTETIDVGRRTISVSHADRVLFGAAGVTKLDLARYYATVGEAMVPHVRERPLALQVFPGGVEGDGHFLKNAPQHFPSWIKRAPVPKRGGGTIHQVLANEPAALAYLAGQNATTPHIWTSRADRLERPDRIVFDLDPADQDFAEVRATARALGELLRELGFEPFAMTTGSRGLHVVVALRRTEDYKAVYEFAHAVADALTAEDPDNLTTAFRREKRGERLFVDVNRNAYGQHAVAPYAVRAKPNAPVATPLHWDELNDGGLDPQGWTVATLPARVEELGRDPWHDIARSARALGPARRALEQRQS
jgi:bifunctional non-homologous end joining protein LigD